jgi:hypothetical protein
VRRGAPPLARRRRRERAAEGRAHVELDEDGVRGGEAELSRLRRDRDRD